jgi:uncharacterized ferritin-like protein (DUF455 family)
MTANPVAALSEIGHFNVDGLTLRAEPARDACFEVVYRDAEMHEYPADSDIGRREMVHRHMTNEITSLDMAASCLAEFPDEPWDLRLELARQCYDEARHVRALQQRLAALGGYKGEFPISTLEWNIVCAVDDLVGRLAIQNRTLEAGAMDVVLGLSQQFRAAGDADTADLLDAINNDEIQHVRFANRWIRRLAKDDPRVLMRMARAIRFMAAASEKFQIAAGGEVNAVGTALASPEQRIPAVNVEDRRRAEFTDDEIHEILRQAGYRSLLPAEAQA